MLKKLGISKKPNALCFPREESYPTPPMRYRVSFVDHLIRGLSAPIHPFLRGLLFIYGLQLHHLTPNSILHISIFITLCEAFLGVQPNWALWKRIFCRRNGSPNVAYNIGGISVRPTVDYFDVKLPDSVQGWRKKWLYIQEENHGCAEDNIPPFDGAEKIFRRHSWDAEATEEERTSTKAYVTCYTSSTKSGEEETSATRYVSTRAREKLAKIFNDMSFESSADSYISDSSSDVDSYDFIDKSLTVGKVFINLNDDVTKPNVDLSTKYHQIYAIEDQEETSEAFDSLGNPYVDPSNLRQGLGNKYVGPEPRDRVQLSQAAWDRAARAMNGTEPMATTATPEELQAYQYRLARAARELEKQTAELNRRKEAASHPAGEGQI
ncbi:hypothetical protein QYE76_033043 [Lolium multiflorum]|uniref:Transposase (putative) gypsy type domain-containing protein n=1 Tax=Lolium multiflorum TaxID=4521 RepID=A0AAD8QVY3_LOLMU|nr:hypothetical protein QYE76_033043 [Lolium multiflorum]